MDCICLSTAEAEYYALSQAMHAPIPVRSLLKEICTAIKVTDLDKPDSIITTVHEDNNPPSNGSQVVLDSTLHDTTSSGNMSATATLSFTVQQKLKKKTISQRIYQRKTSTASMNKFKDGDSLHP